MPLGTFVPGVYTGTYHGSAIGLTTSDGFRLRFRHHVRRIENTASYGDSHIDGIYRGGDCQIVTTLKEWNAIVREILWPWSNTSNPVLDGKMGVRGILESTAAKALVLTAQSGSPANTSNGPSTLTATYAILAAENDFEFLMGPDERDVPVIFDLLPYTDGSDTRWFSVT